ncbi:MAG: hypothetical protein V2I57_07750 [Xanthomonadales bacterium]|jgi:hypothetical protein|nr:hypothetical protein [Xanthomonadales bacterium]
MLKPLHPLITALAVVATLASYPNAPAKGDGGSVAGSAIGVETPVEPGTTMVMLEPPVADGSLAPRLVRLDPKRLALTWLERLDGGHRMRFAVLENGRFGSAGTIAEGSFFANWADTPGMTVMPDGAWIAHWLQRSGSGTYAYDIRVAISLDEGASWGTPFTPHRDGTKTEHGFVSYYPDAAGAGLAWLDGRNTLPAPTDRSGGHHDHGEGGSMTLRTAVITLDGTLGQEVQLDDRVCDCCATASARTSEGPIVVYRDRSETEIRDIAIVRRTETGWSDPVPVHKDGWRIAGCPVNGPAVLADGQTVVVAWFTLGADETPRVHLARSADGGRSFGAPLTFNRESAIGRVDLAQSATGFFMSWMAAHPSPDQNGARLRLARFDERGALVRIQDLADLPGRRGNGFPRLAALPAGDVLMAWTEGTPEGSRVRVARAPASP